MGRTNPLGLRVSRLINWRSSVRQPFLTDYVRHVFQQSLVGTPGIRASTTGLWVNITILQSDTTNPNKHPLLTQENPALSGFASVKISEVLGRDELRIGQLANKLPFHTNLWKNVHKETVSVSKTLAGANTPESKEVEISSPLIARAHAEGPLAALKIFRDTPIHLQINLIRNPILDAEIMAQYVAGQIKKGVQLPRLQKNIMSKLELAPK
ncbi:hypothetical protein HK100_008583 [Physocladia obscura]|uniref:Uncharacterized protein n=1 Tax=Physocladia obscura TaxID=109957 RepID=A0AAD5T4K4_9FUNG|nr:hypothetical protein HK100_008583 [Physocladia obscura]